MLEPGILISMALAAVAGIVWAVRIEGRVNAHQTLFDEREKLAEDRYEQLEKRLIRIEAKLDRNDSRQDRQDTRIDRYSSGRDNA